MYMSVTVGRDKPNTGRSVFDSRSDGGLDEEEIKMEQIIISKVFSTFLQNITLFRLPAWVISPQCIALRNNVLFGRSSNVILYNSY